MSISSGFHRTNFYQFRVIVIGDSTVGKSSLLQQFIKGQFNQDPDPTIGVDFHIKTISLAGDTSVKLQVWDTAGQERFRAITRSYYRNCSGCIIMYDLTCRRTFENVLAWLEDSKSAIDQKDIVFMLVGHKVDLESQREVYTAEGESFAQTHNMLFIETSAKILCNVEETFVRIANEIYKRLEDGKVIQKPGWDGIKVIPFRPKHVNVPDYEPNYIESNRKCSSC